MTSRGWVGARRGQSHCSIRSVVKQLRAHLSDREGSEDHGHSSLVVLRCHRAGDADGRARLNPLSLYRTRTCFFVLVFRSFLYLFIIEVLQIG